MKNILCILLLVKILVSCHCEREELSKIEMLDSKTYVNTANRSVSYIDNHSEKIPINFSGATYYWHEENLGPETCQYNSYERAKENFNSPKFNGIINYTKESITIEINYNNNKSVVNIGYGNGLIDTMLQDIQINNFTFTHVFVLEKIVGYEESGLVDKIIFSKTHGIEYILFEDGSWFKKIN